MNTGKGDIHNFRPPVSIQTSALRPPRGLRCSRWREGGNYGCPLFLIVALSACWSTFAADNPALERFGRAIVLYASFDGRFDADLSPAAGAPISAPKADLNPFASGVFGQALASGDFDLSYDLGDTRLSRSGAAAIWVAKTSKRDDPGYFWPVRLFGSDRLLMIGRMGDPRNKETLYGHGQIAGAKGDSATLGSALDWKEGEWHLLVLNFRSDSIEFSVDGQPPRQANLPKPTGVNAETKSSAERVTISTKRADGDQFLLDELILFKAPLLPEEIAWLYENGKQGK